MTLRKFIKRYNEWLSLPVALALFFAVPNLYRMADGTAGSFDAGYLHTLVFAVVAVNFASGIAWFMFMLSFPDLYRYFDNQAERDVIANKAYFPSSAVLAFGVYFAYFLTIIILIVSII